MTESLRALMTGVIDYAGLFPPASLPLDAAARNYSAYLHDPDRWMLSRFICPASKLDQLPRLDPSGWRISALGRAGTNAAEFIDGLRKDCVAVKAMDQGIVDAFETRLPPDSCNISIEQLVTPEGCDCFFECTPGGDPLSAIAFTVESLVGAGHGFKLRTGGVEAAAFPPVKQIAFAITCCRDAKVSIKFTAGLHHPIRHFHQSVDTTMHGFLNVFVAAVMAHVHKLDQEAVAAILADETPADFKFDGTGVRWNDLSATTEQIRAVRSEKVISFGSCSFDEPRDDLRALGLL